MPFHLTTKQLDNYQKKLADMPSGCIEWTGASLPNGYGVLCLSGGTAYAHRVAWEIAYGPIPEGKLVCHTCDNRKCVNPEHLFLGTSADNSRDMIKKNRSMKGEVNPKSRLSEDDVREIRRMRSLGMTWEPIAERFNVSSATARFAGTGRTWAHVDYPVAP